MANYRSEIVKAINPFDFRQLVAQKSKIRDYVRKGEIIYIDGHLCLNMRRYVEFNPLTNKHVLRPMSSQKLHNCLLPVLKIYKDKYYLYGDEFWTIGECHKDYFVVIPDNAFTAQSFERMATYKRTKKEFEIVSSLIKDKSITVVDALANLMDYKDLSSSKVELFCNWPEGTVEDLLTETEELKLEELVAFLLVLRIPADLSIYLVNKYCNVFELHKGLNSVIESILSMEADPRDWYEVVNKFTSLTV